jgi:geranylgeranyl diphosphate synthase, type I
MSVLYQELLSKVHVCSIECLESFVPSHYRHMLLEACQESLRVAGKLYRSRMLFAATQAVGGDPQKVIPAAVAIEVANLATLVHDDIIDQDEVRRDQPSMWKQSGIPFAILGGSIFYLAPFSLLASCCSAFPSEYVVRATALLSAGLIGVNLGQALELQEMKRRFCRPSDCMEVGRLKTGALLGASLACGAALGGGSEEQIQALLQCGDTLGIAYQIINDVLTYSGKALDTKKPLTGDLREQRVTLPILYAFEDGNEADRQMLLSLFVQNHPSQELEESFEIVKGIVLRTGARERIQEEALSLLGQVIEEVQVFPDTRSRHFLENVITGVVKDMLRKL